MMDESHEETRDRVCDYEIFKNTTYCQQQNDIIIACGGGTSRLFTADEIDFLYFKKKCQKMSFF